MLLTLVTWHVAATAVLLAVYLLVAVLQWSVVQVRGSARRSSPARRTLVTVPAARREGEAGHAVVGTAA